MGAHQSSWTSFLLPALQPSGFHSRAGHLVVYLGQMLMNYLKSSSGAKVLVDKSQEVLSSLLPPFPREASIVIQTEGQVHQLVVLLKTLGSSHYLPGAPQVGT